MNHKRKPVKVGSTSIGDGSFSIWAGPCSVESLNQLQETASQVKKLGATGLRGGLYKLRTDPAAFQGLGRDAYQIVRQVTREVGLPFVSEITDPRQLNDMYDVVDAFQVGSRNMHNYSLLQELSRVEKPVLLKRGFSATFKEWMLAAEYLIKGGNDRIILCERGIRTFETATRNTFDINAIALAKAETGFPVFADPSHGTGQARLVPAIALAAAAAGADGLLIEVHPDPAHALSDGFQSLDFEEFGGLMKRLPRVLEALDRSLAVP
jgi:3-deoxy-7-phosphoheptulonate synthase